MSSSQIAAILFVGGGMALLAVGLLMRVYRREERLAEILDLPWGEKDVDLDAAVEQHSALVENTIGVAGRLIDQMDDKGKLLTLLERARLPIRPGEFALFVLSGGVVLAALVTAVTTDLMFGAIAAVASPFIAVAYLHRRIDSRTRKFEEQFPEALSLIASSLTAGHTFLRSIQMMCEEAEGPIAEEFARVVYETQLGDPLVDALDRMAKRLDIRDVDWVVQAIRIQQTVGGKLADLLHTLADFIRAREEVRREVRVLTAEGRISAYILGALPIFLGFFMQVSNPDYLDPLFQGWGLVWIAGSIGMIAAGMTMIFRMIKVDV
ncbi:MAG TPA: type II secretion system F family protein [Acidimicrobiales bacterium]|nr:type II secretion system F family protein [Acidimicrobiales bacterium]